jgi:alpha-L-arabinofuranosidase
MLLQTTRFDSYDRAPNRAKIYFGEYAVTSREAGTGSLEAAVAEAAFMTGFERNGDAVVMSSYAPLLSHIDWKAWNPNAIVFDQARIYGTPSYHVQAMFSRNRADQTLPVRIEQPARQPEAPRGMVGLGTWRTRAEYKDVRVTKGDQTLMASDFSRGLEGWKTSRGKWEAVDGVLRQTGDEENVRAIAGDLSWSDYTITLKARKLGGREGFLIMFQAPGDETTSWWNLGGWDNTEHALQVPGVPDNRSSRVRGQIETGRWYDIRVELKGQNIKAYLDGKLIHDAARPVPPALYATAGRDRKTGEIVLKVVNASVQPQEVAVEMKGLTPEGVLQGTALVLTSDTARDENSFAAPAKVAPRESRVQGRASDFRHTFPAHSVTVLRLKASAR